MRRSKSCARTGSPFDPCASLRNLKTQVSGSVCSAGARPSASNDAAALDNEADAAQEPGAGGLTTGAAEEPGIPLTVPQAGATSQAGLTRTARNSSCVSIPSATSAVPRVSANRTRPFSV